ncbi:unnamed protein product [Prunus armeniaca]
MPEKPPFQCYAALYFPKNTTDRLHPTSLVRLVGGQPWDARLRSSGFVWGVDFHLGWRFANLTVRLVFISSLLSFVQPFQSSSERFSIRDLSLASFVFSCNIVGVRSSELL